MAEQNVVDNLHSDKRGSDLGGLLEQMNVPPKIIEKVERHQKTILVILIVVVVAIVAGSLYKSYVDNRRTASTTALARAMESDADNFVAEMESVVADFPGTEAALWAQLEKAKQFAGAGKFQEALSLLQLVEQDVAVESPLYPLCIYGKAQAEEALGNLDAALKDYTLLHDVKGYERIGYTATCRMYEAKQQYAEAVKELEKYLGAIVGQENDNAREKQVVEAKIAQLKGMQ